MKIKSLLIGTLIGGMLISCGGNKSKDDGGEEKTSSGISDAVNGLKNLNKMADAASDVEKLQEKLTVATPLSNDEMKEFLPESLSGMKRATFSVGTQMVGVTSANATYSGDEDKKAELTVIDGAGETGAAIIVIYSMGLMMDREEQTESGFTKTTKVNGHRAEVGESTNYDRTDSKISLLVSDRYFVTLDGKGIKLSDLEKMINEIPLNKMK